MKSGSTCWIRGKHCRAPHRFVKSYFALDPVVISLITRCFILSLFHKYWKTNSYLCTIICKQIFRHNLSSLLNQLHLESTAASTREFSLYLYKSQQTHVEKTVHVCSESELVCEVSSERSLGNINLCNISLRIYKVTQMPLHPPVYQLNYC
jgi:hypothetical protein